MIVLKTKPKNNQVKYLKVKCIENSYSATSNGKNIINMNLTIGKFYNVECYNDRLPYYHLIDDNGKYITHSRKFFITAQEHRKNQLKLIGI